MANLEVLALDTAVPQIRAPGAGDGYSVPRDMTMASGTTLSAQALTAAGNLTLNGGTANGVLYLNGSKVATSGSALTFDGTTLNNTGAAPNIRSTITGGTYYTSLNADGVYANSTDLYLLAPASKFISFYANNAEQMRLTSTGLGIGTTPSGYLANKVVISTGTDSNNGITIASATNRNGSIWFADGTTGDQAYRGGVDYQHTIDTLYLYSGGQGNFQLTSSGNLGLGVTPSAWSTLTAFQVKNAAIAGYLNNLYAYANTYFDGTNVRYIASDFATQYRQTGGQHQFYTAPSGTAGNAITFTQAATLDANGTWLLGTTTAPAGATSANKYSVVKGSTEGVLVFGKANTGGGAITGNAGAGILFYTYTGTDGSETYSERARITAGGDFCVGKTGTDPTVGLGMFTQPNGALSLVRQGSTNGTQTLLVYSLDAAAYRFYVGMDGTVNATNTTITAISDQRLKENIRDIDAGLDKVMALKPRTFDWKAGKGKDIKNDRGWIAQEFEQVFPDMISEWKDPAPEGEGPYKAVRADLIPVLVKAMQEQQAMINELKAKIAVLENK